MCSVASPDTQPFTNSTSKMTEKSLNNLQKQNKITTPRTLSVPKNTLLKRLYQIVATMNVIWIPQNKIDIFTVLYAYNPLFYST